MEILNDGKFIVPNLEIKKLKKNHTLDGFLDFLNPPRKEQGMPEISYARLQRILKGMDSWGKSIFLGSCKDAQNPSAYFWWKIKQIRKVNK